MMNRGKLEHILAYARQQKQFGSPTCRIPPGDMVEIMERLLAQPVSGGYTLPPHVYRELVNSLRDTAVKYQGTQQLREQLSRTLMQNGLSAAAPEGGN
ncbi:hypothetical protein ACJ8OA_06260 [Serratia sp. CY68630]|uniref:hypothetical protein n=1 Tax=Serratia sp. CY68630 TaxID=3383666 RepID=UPI003FA10102